MACCAMAAGKGIGKMQLMDAFRGVVPGLASGKLKQILFSIPCYFDEVAQLRTRRDFYMWFYYKFPYSSHVPGFPPYVNLSVTEWCNLSCVHCYRNLMPWSPHDMELPLFGRIVDEIAKHPECLLKLQGLGEPAVHPQIRSFVSLLAESKVKTTIYTNGTLLERFSPHEIVELGFGKLVVSIDGIDAQSYESIRVGGNYAPLRANVARLRQTRGELKSRRPRIEIRHVIFPNESSEALRQFRRDWLEFADTVKFNNLTHLSPQPRGVSAPMFRRCRDIRREFYIGSGGQVPVCGCRFWSGTTEEVLGDLHHATIQELWQHPTLRSIRSCHERAALDDVPFCRTCIEHPSD